MNSLRPLIVAFLLTSAPLAANAEECDDAAKLRNEVLKSGAPAAERETRLREAIKLCPSLAEASFDLGQVLVELGRIEPAIASFEAARKAGSEVRYDIALANLYATRNSFAEAEKIYRELIEREPKDPRAYQGLSYVLVARGDLDGAEQALRRGIQIEPGAAKLYYSLGVVLEKLNRPEEAIPSFQAAADRDASSAESFIKLGDLLARTGKDAAAKQALQRAVVLDAQRADIWQALAAVMFRMHSFREAEEALVKAQVLGATDPTVNRDLGIVLVSRGEKARGIAKLEDAMRASGEGESRARATSALGWGYLQDSRLEDAKKTLEEAIRLNGSDAFAHNNLGVVYELEGNKEVARRHFERAKELGPGLAQPELNLRILED